MCIADEDEKLRICYGLLETLAEVTTPFVNSLDKKKIISLIKEKLDEFNDPNSDAISRVRAKVDDVKNQMVDNIDEIVKNLDKLQDIAVTSDDMAQEAQGFRRTTQKVKCSALVWWLTLVALLVAIILAVIIVIIIVVRFGECCHLLYSMRICVCLCMSVYVCVYLCKPGILLYILLYLCVPFCTSVYTVVLVSMCISCVYVYFLCQCVLLSICMCTVYACCM